MTTNKRGGYRENSGAKPKPPAEVASVRIVANVTPAEAQEWARRGRTAWLRAELRKIATPDNKKPPELPPSTKPAIDGRIPTAWLLDHANELSTEEFYNQSLTEEDLKRIINERKARTK
jgi:hypothetical protein